MSSVSNQNAKKLNRMSMAPSIIGLFVASIVFLMLIAMSATLLLNSTVTNRVVVASEKGKKVAQNVINRYHEPGSKEEVYSTLSEQINKNRDMLGLVVTDKDGKIIGIKGLKHPDFEDVYRVRVGNDIVHIALTSEDSVIRISDGDLILDVEGILDANVNVDREYIINMLESPAWATGNAIDTHLWFGYFDDADYNVYLLSAVSVTRFELLSLIVAFTIATILFILFFFFQLLAILRTFRARRRIYRVMSTDLITGGNNWLYFTREASKKKYFTNRRPYVFVSFGFEKYSNYSMCNGEEKAEKLLVEIYNILRNNIRGVEVMCRKESAEFALLLIKEDHMVLRGRMCSIISQIGINHPDLVTRFKVGICDTGGYVKNNVANVYAGANLARMAVANAPDYADAWFDDKMKEEQYWVQTVENEMEKALREREFVMYLQPKFVTSTERVGGAEALVRWKRPIEGLIPPGRFIPLFEQNGFIIKLDDFMIGEVARVQAKWLGEGKKLFPISVNVSRAHFTQEDLAEHIRDIVDTYGVPHKYIELELTESAFFDDKTTLLNTVAKLKEYGFPISMDDFGAGYSSLNSLKEMPLDVVKLDAEFFRGNDENLDKAYLIVSQTITLAKRLSMHVVAEGIETREQVDYLAGEECDLIQGYYFAKPMPVDEFENIAYGPRIEKELEA